MEKQQREGKQHKKKEEKKCVKVGRIKIAIIKIRYKIILVEQEEAETRIKNQGHLGQFWNAFSLSRLRAFYIQRHIHTQTHTYQGQKNNITA